MFGSYSAQCDDLGRCLCRANIAGDKCDRCKENYSNFTIGCTKCEDCYDLVQAKVVNLRDSIANIEYSLDDFNPDDISSETKEKNKGKIIKY